MITRSRLLATLAAAACFGGVVLAGPAHAAAPAWAPLAVSGPTNLPPVQSESQRIAVDAEAGQFTLTAYHIAATGTGDFSYPSNTVTNVVTETGAFAVGQRIDVQGVPLGTTITAVGPSTLTLSNPPAALTVDDGATLLATDSSETTAPLAFDAPAGEGEGPGSVEAALNALPVINAGGASVSVDGGRGGKGGEDPYFVAFDGGSLANTDRPLLTADATSLSGSNHAVTITTSLPGGPGTGDIAFFVQNIGGFSSAGTITMSVTLPPGIETTGTPDSITGDHIWSCSPGAGQSAFTCTGDPVVAPGFAPSAIVAPVRAKSITPGIEPVQMTVSGGGVAAPSSYEMPLTLSSIPALPGVQAFSASTYDADGIPDARAAAHPYSGSAAIFVTTEREPSKSRVVPVGEFKDVIVDLPPGLLGNPIATPQCPESLPKCSLESVVGTTQIPLGFFGRAGAEEVVYNIQAPYGYPSKFRFTPAEAIVVNVLGGLRSEEDYGLEVGSFNTPQIQPVFGSFFTFWGGPADPSHDNVRCTAVKCGPGPSEDVAFLTNPSDCALHAAVPPVATLRMTTWQHPDEVFTESLPAPAVTGCEDLDFEADLTFQPGDSKSDSPASFSSEITAPEGGLVDPDLRANPPFKTTVVDLPEGVTLNPSAADGLGACSKAQIGLKGTNFAAPLGIRFTRAANQCPDSSKIGTIDLKSALLANTLHGALYLAAQGDGNPFGSLFAVYLVIEDPSVGVFIKLPGEVRSDPVTGQLHAVFDDNPQLPFTTLKLNFKGGARSPMASPTTCGRYATHATITPWSAPESGPPLVTNNDFGIDQGPNGLPCAPTLADRPFDVGLKAGGQSTTAGAYSPFTFQITRPDGSQELDTLELKTPPGLAATLKGIPSCSEAAIAAASKRTGAAELANASCPAASEVGHVLVGAGAGPTPFYTPGKLYLAGPYRGAPLSVVSVTPAVAGPFDLGSVVVRTAVYVDRTNAQVTAKTDPIPQILEGVPLRIRDVRVILDRKDWTLNPTSCEASAVSVKASGNSGATANLSSRFQVGDCGALAFKPKLSAKLTGGTKRGAHPAFTAEVTYPPGPGYANTKDVQVTLPHSEFLDQAHINTICTRVQAAANACPQGAIYGFAEAETPLLDGKLTGPVFLKSSDHQLPDLAIALKGPDSQPVEVEFAGRIDSVKAQIRNTIEGLPDVPVTKFTLKMKGGKKGLLVNSRNLCKGKVTKMTVKMVGQNNKQTESRPPLTRSCKKAKKAKIRHKRTQLSRLIATW